MNLPLENLEILQESINKLKQENQELKDKLSAIEFWNERYIEHNEKLKKAIEILKEHLMLDVYIQQGEYNLGANDYGIPPLNKEQYELLKEVLENE